MNSSGTFFSAGGGKGFGVKDCLACELGLWETGGDMVLGLQSEGSTTSSINASNIN